MTTTAFTAPELWKWHTMAIYGYRKFSDGYCEYLVHTGWYQNIGDADCVPYVWLPSSYATYEYQVKINNL